MLSAAPFFRYPLEMKLLYSPLTMKPWRRDETIDKHINRWLFLLPNLLGVMVFGLGLSIATKHRGNLWVDDNPTGRAVFILEPPLR